MKTNHFQWGKAEESDEWYTADLNDESESEDTSVEGRYELLFLVDIAKPQKSKWN